MQRNSELEQSTNWHALDTQEVVDRLDTDLDQGLTDAEASERIQRYGPNAVSKAKRKNYIGMFFSQFTDPLVVVLLGAALITLLIRDYIDAGVILVVVLVNAIIGFVQEERAESAIESLAKMLTIQATVLRDGEIKRIQSEELVPGDVVLLQSGDKVPADLRLVSIKNLQADESVLTGESVPVSKNVEPVAPDEPVSDRVCLAYSGTLVTSGSGKGVVVATGNNTEIGLISGLISEAPSIATPLTRKLGRFGRLLSAAVLLVALITFGLGVWAGRSPVDMFKAAVAIAVAIIPEGLPAVVTIVLAVGVRRMAERHAIIRTLPSVETLGSVTVICSDKTGTLTANEMTVRKAHAGGNEFEFEGVGYNPIACVATAVDTNEEELRSEPFIETLRCGLLCNDSSLVKQDDDWIPNGDPTEVALIVSAVKGCLDIDKERKERPRVDVIPFESSTTYMATLNDTPDGHRVIYVKGSLERLLEKSEKQLFDGGERDVERERILDRADHLARLGYRVLAFARKIVPASMETIDHNKINGLTYLGLQAMSDPARPEAISAIAECKEAGIEVKMITGDHITTALAISRDLGITKQNGAGVTGAQLRELSGEEFDRVANEASVFARVAPEQKYRLVEALQSRGAIIAMTGDGVNDAPALKKADVGVAMGKAGSEVAKDASDMVLTDDNFASIVAAVEEGRTVFSNLLKSLAFLLPTSVGEGLVIIAALLVGFVLPVTPVQILWINTVTAITLGLPLAFEPIEPGQMQQPPRDPQAPLLSSKLIGRIFLVAAFMVIATFLIFRYERGIGASIEEARTAAVGTIVLFEMFYLFSARSENVPVWQTGLFSNPYVWLGVSLVTIFQIAFTYVPIMNFFFGSDALPWEVWLRMIIVSFPITLIVGLEKWIRLKISQARAAA